MRYLAFSIFSLICILSSCGDEVDSNKEMATMLSESARRAYAHENDFCAEAKLRFYDSVLHDIRSEGDPQAAAFYKSIALLELGDEAKSAESFQSLLRVVKPSDSGNVHRAMRFLAVAYLREGERTNCLHNHGTQSCLFPIAAGGVHADPSGSRKAIEIYKKILAEVPDDLESRWLLNIAYMTIGGYPQDLPPALLIPGLDKDEHLVRPFEDVAGNIGLNTNNLAGGCLVDDFNNDGYPDVITSSWSLSEGMHYARNNGNGTFTDLSDSSGLSMLTGGLNIMQTDYNNDGFKDIFVLRGAWKGPYGKEPNSLLKNNGDGTFTDVTVKSGLLSFHPTQTATWNDFNNDGWLDVFIGNESSSASDSNVCEFYLNNHDGTFTNSTVKSKLGIQTFVKGVVSGDYDNDGLADIFISTLRDKKILMKNMGMKDGIVQFRDVTVAAGLGNCHALTFPTGFLDYDNDGWLDLIMCSYEFKASLGTYFAMEALGRDPGEGTRQFLFRNKHDGTFEDITNQAGLNRVAFSMGFNFGDFNNDGYPDLYMATGNPLYQSLVPNKLFMNTGGGSFTDVTTSARVGNLQKGHGVAFADLDGDGDQDLFMDMGGAYKGDAYQNPLYLNPGQNNNGYIKLNLEGTTSNRAAIGARIRVVFRENGIERSVYRDVNSGGSFGSNPLMQHIGTGGASVIDRIEIRWPVTRVTQVLRSVKPGQTITVREGEANYVKVNTRAVDFVHTRTGLISCNPSTVKRNL